MEKFDILALGEVLLRLSSSFNERLTRGETFEKQVGGAELNVLSGISLLGLRTGIISKLPANDIGSYAKNKIRFCGISDDYLTYDTDTDARMGLYFYENGSHPRKPRIVYDRMNSSINKITLEDFDQHMYSSTRCFHTSGITLGLCDQVRQVTGDMIKEFKAAGALISFDVNYRSNLWSGEDARYYIEQILPYVDILFCSEDTARLTFNKTGTAQKMMKEFTEEYPISVVASTKRIVHSPKVHTFSSILCSADNDYFYEEKPYEHIEVVDRIGSGDAYVSGILYGLLSKPHDYQSALEYGNALSALKNTIPGDLSCFDLSELETVISTHKNSEMQLEMNR